MFFFCCKGILRKMLVWILNWDLFCLLFVGLLIFCEVMKFVLIVGNCLFVVVDNFM